MLHGNPAVDVYGGLKLAAGGELGVGVGEEEWGSGEREVLEEYARRTDGLVDIVVSRFGECHPNQEADQKSHKVTDKPPNQQQNEPWMGRGAIPGSGDGVVFSGVGAISRSSLRSVSHWVEWIYTFGEHTYGVRESPTSGRARSRRRTANPARSYSSSRPDSKRTSNESSFDGSSRRRYAKAHAPGIPPPIVSAAESSLQKASAAIDASSRSELSESGSKSAIADPEVWMKYLTLGYSSWGSSSNASRGNDPSGNKPSEQHPRAVSPKPSIRNLDSQPDHNREAEFQENLRRQVDRENAGHFIIGLKGDMSVDEEADATPEEDSEWNSRTLLRTIHVQTDVPLSASSSQLTDVDKMISAQYQARAYRRVRLVVYIVSIPARIMSSYLRLPAPTVHLYVYVSTRSSLSHTGVVLSQLAHVLFAPAPCSPELDIPLEGCSATRVGSSLEHDCLRPLFYQSTHTRFSVRPKDEYRSHQHPEHSRTWDHWHGRLWRASSRLDAHGRTECPLTNSCSCHFHGKGELRV